MWALNWSYKNTKNEKYKNNDDESRAFDMINNTKATKLT
jgi:hypothetical protein